MPNEFTEVTSQSWLSRLGKSILGLLFGLLLIPGSVWLLSWNEGRSLTTAKSLDEGRALVVPVSAGSVQPENNRRLIHLEGKVSAAGVLKDAKFGIATPGLRLERQVEIYQWKETTRSEERKKPGGGTDTQKTYNYREEWTGQPISSSDFRIQEGHRNTGSLIAENRVIVSDKATLGAFRIPGSILHKMSGAEPLKLPADILQKLPAQWKARAHLIPGGLFFGRQPEAPAIGDQRVSFQVIAPGLFSMLARQSGHTLEPFPTRAGDSLLRVESGRVSADAMFDHAVSENRLMTWGLRALGCLFMALGFQLFLSPLSVFADVIPLAGDLMGFGTGLVAALLAIAGTLVTIAIAWMAVRPLMSGIILAAAAAVAIWIRILGRKRKVKAAR